MATRTVDMADGSGQKRLSLPDPMWEGEVEIGTGRWLTAVYVGQVSKRIVLRTNSIWQTRDGIEFTRWHEATEDDRPWLVRLLGGDVAEAIDRIHKPEIL